MSDVIIRIEKLGKRYRIGGPQVRYKTLRESLLGMVTGPVRSLNSALRGKPNALNRDTIWALRDVSFEVKQGEVIGIIGRNGAGKSTLLKVLTRITEPTEGMAEIHGRVGSLLEVGTGFHPELTGRENIYLNGAILGMKKAEIDRRFDEIVEFSGVEKFIDTPTKRYSSGMEMRLAFSVSAHLDPEILLVDEVLAVGDAEFQKKCLGKMGEVAQGGRTVLFVSHQMNAVRTLCNKCLLLTAGNLLLYSDPESVISRYLQNDLSDLEWTAGSEPSRLDNPYFNPKRMAVVDRELRPISGDIRADEQFGILIEGSTEIVSTALTIGFAVHSASGELLFWALHTDTSQEKWPAINKGHNRLVAWMPKHFLNEGDYSISLMSSLHYITWLSKPGMNAPTIRVSIKGGLSESPFWIMARPGLTAPIIPFEAVLD